MIEAANSFYETDDEDILKARKKFNELIEKFDKEIEEVHVDKAAYVDSALWISSYNYLQKLNSFKSGYFTVQDESSMFVSRYQMRCACPVLRMCCSASRVGPVH